MKTHKISARNHSAMTCIVLSLYLLIAVSSGHAQEFMTEGFETDRIAWKSLFLEAKNFFVTLNSKIHFKISPAEDINSKLIQPPEGTAINASGPEIAIIEVKTVIDPLMGSTESIQKTAWCDIKNMTALQQIRLRRGGKDWQKTYRFTAEGVFRQKEEPGTFDKTGLPKLKQNDTKNSFYPYELNKNKCSNVLEASEMFLIASLIDSSAESQPLNLCVFSKQKLYTIEVHAAAFKPIMLDYIEKTDAREIRRNKTIDSIRISFKILPSVEENQQSDEFSFLGLNGDFDIYIDKATKIPVRVSGRAPGFGEVDLNLSSAVLR